MLLLLYSCASSWLSLRVCGGVAEEGQASSRAGDGGRMRAMKSRRTGILVVRHDGQFGRAVSTKIGDVWSKVGLGKRSRTAFWSKISSSERG